MPASPVKTCAPRKHRLSLTLTALEKTIQKSSPLSRLSAHASLVTAPSRFYLLCFAILQSFSVRRRCVRLARARVLVTACHPTSVCCLPSLVVECAFCRNTGRGGSISKGHYPGKA
jgi:hypothetical protein